MPALTTPAGSMSTVKPTPAADSATAATPQPSLAARWCRPWSTWGLALAGAALWYASFPPLGLFPLAWVALIPWLTIVLRREIHAFPSPLVGEGGRRPDEGDQAQARGADAPRSPKELAKAVRRAYWGIYFGAFLGWLGVLHWLRLPHPITAIGWFALCGYLAIYPVLFIGICRQAVHRCGLPLTLVAPIVWVALEYARAYLLTGFSMANWSHTQVTWPLVLQIADIGGAYAVSFVLVAVAAGLSELLFARTWRAGLALGCSLLLLAGTLAYGAVQLQSVAGPVVARIALVQGNVPQTLKVDPKAAEQVLLHYARLTEIAQQMRPDLIVWPETMYRRGLVVTQGPIERPAGADWSLDDVGIATRESNLEMRDLARRYHSNLLLGVDTFGFGPLGMLHYNSAALVDRQTGVLGRYDKVHRVMFGEYIPLGDWWPGIYKYTPMPAGVTPGPASQLPLELNGLPLAVNICFESTSPQLIRGQMVTGLAAGKAPAVLINLTNDGWFWGSSELDLHLACSVLRAIENRRPVVIAANTGFSAHIDPWGRVLWQGKRRGEDVHLAEVQRTDLISGYVQWGDWFAATCLMATVAVLGWAGWKRRQATS